MKKELQVKLHLTDSGKNKTIELPEEVVKEYNLQNEVDAELLSEGILIRGNYTPRAGWASQFTAYAETTEEDLWNLLVNESDDSAWTW